MNKRDKASPGIRKRFQIVAGCLLLAAVAVSAIAQQAVILVRHAEKADASKDPVLSKAGQARARALAILLAGAGVSAVYSSEYQRTKLTAGPIAAALNIPVQTFPASDPAGLTARLRTVHAGEIVLVVGHSNTLPELMKHLGHPVAETIKDDDYGSIFVLVPRAGQAPVVIRLKY